MDEAEFGRDMLSLIDVWCDRSDAAAYATTLWLLYHAVFMVTSAGLTGESGQRWVMLRPERDVACLAGAPSDQITAEFLQRICKTDLLGRSEGTAPIDGQQVLPRPSQGLRSPTHSPITMEAESGGRSRRERMETRERSRVDKDSLAEAPPIEQPSPLRPSASDQESAAKRWAERAVMMARRDGREPATVPGS